MSNAASRCASPHEIDYAESQRPRPGGGIFADFAAPYGTLEASRRRQVDLNFYDYDGKLSEAMTLALDLGFQPYIAGGRFEPPDLARRNFYTGYLMLYDPLDQSGRIARSVEYALAYSIIHELGHALTLEGINHRFGEGRRLGALGRHRTLREAIRAVTWEIEVCKIQRELSARIGVLVADADYERDRNTVLAEAVMRAVTGRFTEPNNEGFVPHSRHVDEAMVLQPIWRHAAQLGLTFETHEPSAAMPSINLSRARRRQNPFWPVPVDD